MGVLARLPRVAEADLRGLEADELGDDLRRCPTCFDEGDDSAAEAAMVAGCFPADGGTWTEHGVTPM